MDDMDDLDVAADVATSDLAARLHASAPTPVRDAFE
jgi:hypothetical protein